MKCAICEKEFKQGEGIEVVFDKNGVDIYHNGCHADAVLDEITDRVQEAGFIVSHAEKDNCVFEDMEFTDEELKKAKFLVVNEYDGGNQFLLYGSQKAMMDEIKEDAESDPEYHGMYTVYSKKEDAYEIIPRVDKEFNLEIRKHKI